MRLAGRTIKVSMKLQIKQKLLYSFSQRARCAWTTVAAGAATLWHEHGYCALNCDIPSRLNHHMPGGHVEDHEPGVHAGHNVLNRRGVLTTALEQHTPPVLQPPG